MFYNSKKISLCACIMLAAMLGLLLASIRNESAIVDELAHIPAGFSYATELDFRLNPEHPPLLKLLSGIFVRVMTSSHLNTTDSSWSTDVNGQWGMGYSFLYGTVGNDADAIIYWARIPVILLAVVLGWLLYQWLYRHFGLGTALLTLLFFSFSPTILAHSRYMTTDLGASFGFFIGIASFIALLERPSWHNALGAGLCFGIAQLLKFSLVLLVPIDGILLIAWIVSLPDKKEWLPTLRRLIIKIIAALMVALALIWIVYGVLTYNYPQERQLSDTAYILTSYGFRPAVDFDLALIKNPLTRPLGHYLLGVLMVQQRAAGGNTAYFLDEVSARGSRLYFPLLYLVKEPLPLHIFSLFAIWYGLQQWRVWRKKRQEHAPDALSLGVALRKHIVEFSCVVMIAVYWLVSIKSPLNIGVRHVLPTFPFIYILVSRGIVGWMRANFVLHVDSWRAIFSRLFTATFSILPRYVISALLIIWLVFGTITTAPYFLSFYNELAGGTSQGWKIAVDSNYDWGQDLKRLADFVYANNIAHIAVDYFGGGVPSYYMKDRQEHWWSDRGQAKGWFAISATYRQGSFGTPAPGFIRDPLDNYDWLKPYTPVARAGYSIFIYKLPE